MTRSSRLWLRIWPRWSLLIQLLGSRYSDQFNRWSKSEISAADLRITSKDCNETGLQSSFEVNLRE
jgi:hypothetical protein